MQFGSSDKVSTVPVSVTSTSVTLQWFEAKEVPTGAEQYVGYTLYYIRATESVWTSGPDIPYTADRWQTGTVTGLDPDTEYQFNIAVYRQWTDGTRFESTFWAYKETTTIPLSATTWRGNNKYNAITLHIYHWTSVIYVIYSLSIHHIYVLTSIHQIYRSHVYSLLLTTPDCRLDEYGPKCNPCHSSSISHCKEGRRCDQETGGPVVCTQGCEVMGSSDTWWVGERCNALLG